MRRSMKAYSGSVKARPSATFSVASHRAQWPSQETIETTTLSRIDLPSPIPHNRTMPHPYFPFNHLAPERVWLSNEPARARYWTLP